MDLDRRRFIDHVARSRRLVPLAAHPPGVVHALRRALRLRRPPPARLVGRTALRRIRPLRALRPRRDHRGRVPHPPHGAARRRPAMTAVVTATAVVAQAADAPKVYGTGDTSVRALDDVDVEFPGGRFTAIMGPSGSGKSTLMHCLAGLDTLTSGEVFVDGVELGSLSDKELTRLRRER